MQTCGDVNWQTWKEWQGTYGVGECEGQIKGVLSSFLFIVHDTSLSTTLAELIEFLSKLTFERTDFFKVNSILLDFV